MDEPIVSNEHLISLGRLVVEWSTLEYTIERAIGFYSTARVMQSLILGSQLDGLPKKLDLLRALVHETFHDEDIDHELMRLCVDQIRPASDKRNHLVHGQWLQPRDRDDPYVSRVLRRSKFSLLSRTTTVNWIEKCVAEIRGADADLNAFAKRHPRQREGHDDIAE